MWPEPRVGFTIATSVRPFRANATFLNVYLPIDLFTEGSLGLSIVCRSFPDSLQSLQIPSSDIDAIYGNNNDVLVTQKVNSG